MESSGSSISAEMLYAFQGKLANTTFPCKFRESEVERPILIFLFKHCSWSEIRVWAVALAWAVSSFLLAAKFGKYTGIDKSRKDLSRGPASWADL